MNTYLHSLLVVFILLGITVPDSILNIEDQYLISCSSNSKCKSGLRTGQVIKIHSSKISIDMKEGSEIRTYRITKSKGLIMKEDKRYNYIVSYNEKYCKGRIFSIIGEVK